MNQCADKENIACTTSWCLEVLDEYLGIWRFSLGTGVVNKFVFILRGPSIWP